MTDTSVYSLFEFKVFTTITKVVSVEFSNELDGVIDYCKVWTLSATFNTESSFLAVSRNEVKD